MWRGRGFLVELQLVWMGDESSGAEGGVGVGTVVAGRGDVVVGDLGRSLAESVGGRGKESVGVSLGVVGEASLDLLEFLLGASSRDAEDADVDSYEDGGGDPKGAEPE